MRACNECSLLRKRLDEIAAALDEIVISEGEDAGLILKSWQSPANWDATRQCFVYEHDHFSELGDALVELRRLVGKDEKSDAKTLEARV